MKICDQSLELDPTQNVNNHPVIMFGDVFQAPSETTQNKGLPAFEHIFIE